MSFDVHPILEAGEFPTKGVWYAISPESTGESGGGPSGKVGASACSFSRESEGSRSVLVFAGATLEGPYAELHQLSFKQHEIKWSQLPSDGLPARYEHASFMSESESGKCEELCVFAGAKLDGPVNDMWKYDLESKVWKKSDPKGCIPSPRTFHTSSSMFHSSSSMPRGSSHLVVFSGGSMSTHPIEDERVYMYDTALNEWTSPDTTGCPPSPRQGHVTAVVGSHLYIHGGMAGQTFLEDLHCLDLVKMEWFVPAMSGTRPPALAAHGSGILDDCLFIFGGWSPSETGPVAQDILYCLHTDTRLWETVSVMGPPPPARFDFAMCSIKIPVLQPAAQTPELQKTENGHRGDKKDKTDIKSEMEVKAESDCKKGSEEVTFPPPERKSFHAITIVDPDEKECTGPVESVPAADEKECTGPVESVPAVAGIVDSIDRIPPSGDKLQWTSALFVFGGIDSSGLVHSDSFVLVP